MEIKSAVHQLQQIKRKIIMIKINFIGRFYFKLTDSKNLIGEFSNNGSGCKRNYAESADRISHKLGHSPDDDDGQFVGNYHQTWFDDEGGKPEAVLAEVEIKRKPGCKNIFSLKWKVLNGKPNNKLWGEGMLCDGLLIGDYRNFENCNPLPSP